MRKKALLIKNGAIDCIYIVMDTIPKEMDYVLRESDKAIGKVQSTTEDRWAEVRWLNVGESSVKSGFETVSYHLLKKITATNDPFFECLPVKILNHYDLIPFVEFDSYR